ncbi:MAG: hypothetical protein LVR00_09220 [Rhabdochlamydiaceae bacterium]|jgi:hypothetical protein
MAHLVSSEVVSNLSSLYTASTQISRWLGRQVSCLSKEGGLPTIFYNVAIVGASAWILYHSISRLFSWIIAFAHERNQYANAWWYRRNGALNMVVVPSDGNCLFHAFGLVLAMKLKIDIVGHGQLRLHTADWIEREYLQAQQNGEQEQGPDCPNPKILDYLRDSMEAYQTVRKNSLNGELDSIAAIEEIEGDNHQIAERRREIEADLAALSNFTREQYVEECRKDRFHGSSVELFALSEMCCVRIKIQRMVGQRILEGFSQTYGKSFKSEIVLVHVDGNHYNSAFPT